MSSPIPVDTADGEVTNEVETTKAVDDLPDPAEATSEGSNAVQGQAAKGGSKGRYRKRALLFGYCGDGFFGSQFNPGVPTIEEEILKAMIKTDMITQTDYLQPNKMHLQRASRTDKGVHAARNCLSLKLTLDDSRKDEAIDRLNSALPESIRVFDFVNVVKGFDAKTRVDSRTYNYLMPTYALQPASPFVDVAWRASPEHIDKFNEILAKFKGVHNFHNYTSKVDFNSDSAVRTIIDIKASAAFVIDDVEFTMITLRGQSFMLNQIRKMVSVGIAVARGFVSEDVFVKAWGKPKVDISRAPALGLFLNMVHYDSYNRRFGNDHDKIEWIEKKHMMEKFKMESIVRFIARREKAESSMRQWLQQMDVHTFDTEQFERSVVVEMLDKKRKAAAEETELVVEKKAAADEKN